MTQVVGALLLVLAACGDDDVAPMGDGGADAGPRADAAVDGDAGPPPPIEVTYADGTVVGRTIGSVHTFLGIPYAAPTVWDLRWRPPEPPPPWTTPRDASELGSICPQINVLAGSDMLDGDEDCLFLNVFTPEVAPSAPMPVLVWIHGGAFVLGSGGVDPGRLAEVSSTVVVTINYRLDVLGFLAHPALTEEGEGASGNYGLYDQRAALAWVRDRIAAFGGDASRVTIAGQSAGGVSVGIQAMSPDSEGLFHRAVVQSGPLVIVNVPTLAEAEAEGVARAEAVGCVDVATAATCLRGKSPAELVRAADLEAVPGGLIYQPGFAFLPPIVDGVFVPESPRTAYAEGRFATVPFIVGSTGDEGTLFHTDLLSTPVADETERRTAIATRWPEDVDAILAMYPLAMYDDSDDALTAISSDIFNCSTRKLARDLEAGGAPTWLYAFEAVPDGILVESLELGSYHTSELLFLYDLDDPTLGRPPADARDLVNAMQSYWSRFAAAADPNSTGTPEWPSYETATDRHMLLVSPPAAGEGYMRAVCDFWDPIEAP
jgi:para-nitrobenzyl esterase